MRRLTIVVPVLNEAAIIAPALLALEPLRARGEARAQVQIPLGKPDVARMEGALRP